MTRRSLATRLLALCLATLTACGGARMKASSERMAAPSPGMAMAGDAMPTTGGDAKIAKDAAETWKRSTIVPNSSRVMVGDREQLTLKSMQTKVSIDGFRARVVIDYLYANEHGRQLEGTFQLRLPEEASPYFFAFGETAYGARDAIQPAMTIATSEDPADDPRALVLQRQGAWTGVKEARMVPRETAQMAYEQTVRRRVDPAIVEWAGAGVFSARVFPLAANKLHRIVVGYDVDLVKIGDDLEYRFELPDDVKASTVDIAVAHGMGAVTTPRAAAKSTPDRQIFHFTGTQDRTIAARIPNAGSPLLVGNDPAGNFFATRTTPALPATAGQTASDAVFLVDTSLSSNPDRFNIWLKLLRATLDGNRDSLKRFNVVFFSVDAHWYKPQFVDNTAANVDELMAVANTLALEGATDLGAALAFAGTAQGSSRYDLFLLSDGAATWGEGNLHALGRTLRATRASLFAYQTGLAGTDVATLGHLARESGGAVFSVTGEAEIAKAATAHRARPWRLLEARVGGASDVMLAGRPLALFPGQTVIATGRGALKPGAELELVVEQNGRRETVRTKLGAPLASPLAARTYGQIATNRLEELGAVTAPLSKAYATHFRVTGQTCSLLMLESEDDYRRFNIKPEGDLEIVKSAHASVVFDRALEQTYSTLGDPKAAFLELLTRLERLPNTRLAIPRDYRATIERLPAEAFFVPSQPLVAQLREKRHLSAPQLARLAKHDVEYDAITADSALRRRASSSDALKALSSLVEHSPGDAVLARDVGYSAMELGLRAQAYHLFRRVADARPHEPQTYRAIAQALASLGKPELALAYYEIPLMGNWDARFGDLRKIVELDYMHFLRMLNTPKASPVIRDYAASRLQTLSRAVGLPRADVVVTITWNTDNTDVDLHVVEPSGEECYYSHRNTKSGGSLTQDVTQGYGPEMYVLPRAPSGNYNVFAHYFAQDRNRTSARTKVYVTMFENWGTESERMTEKVVMLEMGKQRHPIANLAFNGVTVAR